MVDYTERSAEVGKSWEQGKDMDSLYVRKNDRTS